MNKWRVIFQNPETARPGGREGDLLTQERPPSLAVARERLFADLRRETGDQRVIGAMEQVPREFFTPPEVSHLGYEDSALAIGEGQTISQPLIVALMTAALELQGREKVLEVGTGSGYQAAILAHLAEHVVSVECRPGLLMAARRRLAALEIRNADLHLAADGLDWPEEAPYDAIVVTAAAPKIPQSLVRQLREGGRLVIPTGARAKQELLKITKKGSSLSIRGLAACAFVPLIGPEAWEE